MRKTIKACVRAARRWLNEGEQDPHAEVPFDNNYDWLAAAYRELATDPICRKKGVYIWGVLQGAALGKVLGFKRISVIEFGVAGVVAYSPWREQRNERKIWLELR